MPGRAPIRLTHAGTKIGRRTDQKIGFYGVTPVAQRANANQAVATDATSTQALANELRAALVALGLIKGSA
jgi:hypothetical protein